MKAKVELVTFEISLENPPVRFLGGEPLRIERRLPSGWGIYTNSGSCMSKNSKPEEWIFDHEPLPSSRTDEWLKEHRFANLGDALDFIHQCFDVDGYDIQTFHEASAVRYKGRWEQQKG